MKLQLRLTLALTLLAASLAFNGCNTMRGVGKDIERGGEKIQEVAN